MNLPVRILDLRAADYVRHALGEGFALARSLLKAIDFDAGIVWTYLPETVSVEDAYLFKHSKLSSPNLEGARYAEDDLGRVLRMVPVVDAVPEISKFVDTHLTSGPNALCVFQEAIVEASHVPDLPKSRWPYNTAIFEEEVYWFLRHQDAGTLLVQGTVKQALVIYPPLVGALSVLTPQNMRAWNSKSTTLGLADIEAVARQADYILVGAYDGEGVIVWQRSS